MSLDARFVRISKTGNPQHSATHCNTLQHTATHCNTLQHTATHCTTLQQPAAHCNRDSCGLSLYYANNVTPASCYTLSFFLYQQSIYITVYDVLDLMPMTHDGIWASHQSISLMTYYCIAQCMFVFVCVSCRYRLIVYHITTTHVDISKMISVQQLWDIFVSSSVVPDQYTLPSSNSSNSAVPLPTLSPQLLSLDMQLKKFMQAKTPAIHIYTVCPNSLIKHHNKNVLWPRPSCRQKISRDNFWADTFSADIFSADIFWAHDFLHTWFCTLNFLHTWFPAHLISCTHDFLHTWFPAHMISCTHDFLHTWFVSLYNIYSIFINCHSCIKSITNFYVSYFRVDI